MMIWIHVTVLWVSKHFKGLLSWVEWMRDGRTPLTPKKKAAKLAENSNYSNACRLCGINCKNSVGNKNNQRNFQPFPSPKRNFDILNSCQNQLPSSERETASFCWRFNTNPPRQEADRRSKSKHSREILFMPFWPEPWSDECHFLSLKLSTLWTLLNSIVPSTNQVLPLLEQLT